MNSLFRDYEIVARSGLFDPKYYLAAYPDVARRNIDPLMHYLEEGARAVRNPHPDFDAEFYLAQCRLHGHKPENPLIHYLTVGVGLGFKTKPDGETQLFDAAQPNGADEAAETQIFSRPPMLLYIDDADVGPDGVLRVEGWVVCLAPVASVEVLLDAASLGAAEHGRPRVDVAETRATYPNAGQSGFLFVGDVSALGAGSKTITVRATAQTGIVRELVRTLDVSELQRPAPADEAPIRYHCDHVMLTTTGRLSLAGWVVCAAPITTIDVLVDGAKVGVARFGLDRGDVGNLFPSLPHARASGFAVSCRAKPPLIGEHRVMLRAYRNDDRAEDIVLPVLAIENDIEPAVGTASASEPAARALHLDAPVLFDSAMETPVRGKLEVSGWALARAGVAAIEIVVDDVVLMTAEYGLRRRDVQSAFPDWEDTLESGFFALVPHRLLPRGPHQAAVVLRDQAGATSSIDFRILVEPLPDTAGPWALRRKMPAAELDLGQRLLTQQDWHPVFQVLMAVPSGTSLDDVRTTLLSLKAQVYANWRLALLWEAPASDQLTTELGVLGDKCRFVGDFSPGDMPDDTSFLTVLTPGTELGCDAFHEMALVTVAHRDADFLYSDERRLNPGTGEIEAFFKPQWSPDLLLSTNYVGQLWCARVDLVHRALAATENPLLQGSYELVLRLTEAAKTIRHVPSVLCERPPGNFGDAAQDRLALDRAIRRRGIAASVLPGIVGGTYRLKRELLADGLVSIIIPTRAAQGMIERCIDTIRSRTRHRNFEIVCIENIPPEDAHWRDWLGAYADRVISTEEPFNWSRFNNRAVAAARGAFLLFLNDDTEIVDPDWLTVLLEHAQRPEIGVVGPLLLYPDRRIQHAGMFLAAMGQGRHAFRHAEDDDPGYFGLALTERNVMAVTGACLMIRRETFDRLGGFDEARDIVNNDLDFCLRVWQAGLHTVYTPHTRLVHYEAISRADIADDFDAAAFATKWRDIFLAGDPFFSPHLSKAQDAVAADDEPNRVVVTGRPAFLRGDIKKILVVKLDHIGDCIMAFPAVRCLKRHFPESRITVLTSRASRSVWAMEPAVEATIEFDFFHARSSAGEVELSDEDWRRLRDRLQPEHFDLAIDLRKHLETRPVLQHTGARYLAGTDHRNKFPWLDVAVEWEGDPAYIHKRQHNVDDLINLVDAVAAACEIDRGLIVSPPSAPSPAIDKILAGIEERCLVCLHPTAGNDMKQWPVAYFAAVADRLVENNDARIIVIGGPGEEAVGAELLRQMRHADAAISLIGRLPLGDLPALLTRCSLFLGNDSGPKHIAAGLGVPTVSVQSGTVDVYEWGPIGPQAVAVVRDVTCAPCYLPKPEDCRRGLACLRQLAPDAVYAACTRLLLAAGDGYRGLNDAKTVAV
jgi:ADP-heptose:LPS heptosyltransferase/GT2 family glycosyltransferase